MIARISGKTQTDRAVTELQQIKYKNGMAAWFSLILVLLGAAPQAFAVDEINSTFFGNLAIEGYDPVAYFTQNRPIRGQKRHSYEWKGATWRLSSTENLETFKADPERYAPQYGGYCAYAVSQNNIASIDPNRFTIVNDKLYLNYDKKVQQKWLINRDVYIRDADRNWPLLLN